MVRSLPLVLLFACATAPEVRHQAATDAPRYRSFHLLAHPVGQRSSIETRVESLVRTEMRTRGYELAEPRDADLLVSYKILVDGEGGPLAPLHQPFAAPAGGAMGADVVMGDFSDTSAPTGTQHKLVLLLLQERSSLRTVWIGWSVAELGEDEVDEAAIGSLTTLLQRVPHAAR